MGTGKVSNMVRDMKMITGGDLKNWQARADSKHVEPVKDDVTVLFCTDEFLQDIERAGNRRKVFHDLGFDMSPDADPPERIKIDLSQGYDIYDRTLIENPVTGLKSPVGYRRVKGTGKGSIIFQGDKNA